MKTELDVHKKFLGLNLTSGNITLIVLIVLALILALAVLMQSYAERDAFRVNLPIDSKDTIGITSKGQYEVYKLAAEIRQIRSDTSGSLFWLKVVALFVTVGGAVGAY